MSNLRTVCRLNNAVYLSFTCCYNRARCRPRLIVGLSNPIQNPNSLKPRLLDSSNVKKKETLSWGGSRNQQMRMLSSSANSTDAKSLYDNTLAENMQQDKQIAATESDDADSYKPVLTAENMHQQDKQVAAAETNEEVKSNNSKIIKMHLYCSDGIRIDAEPLKRESLVVQANCNFGFDYVNKLKGNSQLLLKVQFYCAERAKIQDDYDHDETLLQQKLNEFNSNFHQANQIHALDLIIAAFELEIRSLVDLLMDDVIDIFLKMTDDEAYDILYVNLRDEFSDRLYKKYCKRVMFHRWAFE